MQPEVDREQPTNGQTGKRAGGPRRSGSQPSQAGHLYFLSWCYPDAWYSSLHGPPSRWDEWMYHIPFAARYSGLDVSYHLNERMTLYWQGSPIFRNSFKVNSGV